MSWYNPKRKAKSAKGGIRLHTSLDNRPSGWGQRWVDALASFTQAKRLERGLRYAKAGQVLSIHVDQGFAMAEVQGSSVRPYKVEIGLPMFTRKQWTRVIDALLKKAFYTAKLLSGTMPRDIDAIFQDAEAPLIPTAQSDLSTDCSCLDVENPCKHIAAVFFILGQEIERNPFLLMEMRGLSRAQLLAEIQARRTSAGETRNTRQETAPFLERPAQTALSHRLNDFFQASRDPAFRWPAERGSPDQLLKPGERIHEMGSPPFWQSDNDFEDVLTRIYVAVRKRVSE